MYFNSLKVRDTLSPQLFHQISTYRLSELRTHWLFCLLFFYFTNFFIPFCLLSLTLLFYHKLETLVRRREKTPTKWSKHHNLDRSIVVIEVIQWLSVSTALVIPGAIDDP